MNQAQQGVVYGYSEATYVTAGGAAPYIQPPLPRRRMSLFRALVIALIAACAIVGVLVLLIWLIYRPRPIQVAVAAATLVRFDLNTTAGDPVLSYDLAARLAVSNPNQRVSIYYHHLEAAGYYQDERFGRAALPVSFQGTRQTDTVPAVLVGSWAMGFGDPGVEAFRGDNSTGVFPVDLWLDGVMRYKFGKLMTTTARTLTVKCPLALRLTVPSGWVECSVMNS